MAPRPRVTSQLPGGRLITLDPFHHGRGNVLFSLGETLTLDMGMSSLHAMLLPNYAIHVLIECTHHHGILHSIASDQGTHFAANVV